MLRFMQGFSIFLWFCLVVGTYFAVKDHNLQRLILEIPANLLFQYSVRNGIYHRKLRLATLGKLR
jgi:hypothetical protein